MEFLIVSGLSGAGKSQAANFLEDLGYFCVDNMPVALLSRFAEFCQDARGRFEKVALVTDVRSQSSFDELFSALQELRLRDCAYHILFIEAPTEVIVRRYKETRRRHPLLQDGLSVQAAVELERRQLRPVRERADWVIDTGRTTLGQLHHEIQRLFTDGRDGFGLPVTVMSFGYKYGIPLEADLVLDVRFLPNPYYVEKLRPLTGLDGQVARYVLENENARTFLEKTEELLSFLLPRYAEEGKQSLTVAIGCTGGRHRSVAVSGALAGWLASHGHNAQHINRDCGRGAEV